MTVKELIKHLKKFDPNLEVICRRYSDAQFFDESEIYIKKAVIRERIRRFAPPDQELILIDNYCALDDPELKARMKDYLFFEGN